MPKQQIPSCPYCMQAIPPTALGPQSCPHCQKRLWPVFEPGGDSLEFWLPAQLGRYEIVAPAGRGGMGRVFQGRDQLSGQSVAIKFPADDSKEPSIRQRFEQEIELLKSLNHPNVARYLAHELEADRPFVVMEWVEGHDLATVVRECKERGTSLDFRTVCGWLQEVCSGLQAMHDRGIVHRDIKPANLIRDVDNRIKLIDLGIAKDENREQTNITRPTSVIGTLAYMSPEQHDEGKRVDYRSDTYSLGVVIYELLTGLLPMGDVQPASALNDTVPAFFSALLRRMMSYDLAK